MHYFIKRISLIIILIAASLAVQATDSKVIKLAFLANPNTDLYTKWLHLIYNDAFNRLGINFSYIVMPALRASRMADLGNIDGETARVASYGDAYPNLIRIEEPILTMNISAYTYDPSIKVQSWQDIKNSQYNVDYYRGIYLIYQRLISYVEPENLSYSSTPEESLLKLIRPKGRGRIDLYIGVEQSTTELLNTTQFMNVKIRTLTRLEESDIYGYLHKRHSGLDVKLAKIFRQMKSEGKFDEYYNQAKLHIEQ